MPASFTNRGRAARRSYPEARVADGAPRPTVSCRLLDRADAGSYVDDERHAGGAGQDAAGRRMERSGCLVSTLVLLAIGFAV